MIYNPGAMPFQQKIETRRVVLRNLQHQGRVAIQGILRHHDQLNVLEGEAVTSSVVRISKTGSVKGSPYSRAGLEYSRYKC